MLLSWFDLQTNEKGRSNKNFHQFQNQKSGSCAKFARFLVCDLLLRHNSTSPSFSYHRIDDIHGQSNLFSSLVSTHMVSQKRRLLFYSVIFSTLFSSNQKKKKCLDFPFVFQNAGWKKYRRRAQKRCRVDGNLAQCRSILKCETSQRQSYQCRQISSTGGPSKLLCSWQCSSIYPNSTRTRRYRVITGCSTKGKCSG